MSRRKSIATLSATGEPRVSKRELAKHIDGLAQQNGLGGLNRGYAKAFATYGKSKEFKSQYGSGAAPAKFDEAFKWLGKNSGKMRAQVVTPEDMEKWNPKSLLPPDVLAKLERGGKTQRGAGIFDFLKKAIGFIHKNELISKIGKMIPNETANKIGEAAGQIGFGQSGGGIFDFLKPVFKVFKPVADFVKPVMDAVRTGTDFIKENQLVSKIGQMIPHPGVQQAASLAGQIGLGRLKGQKPTVPPYSLLEGSGDVRHRGSSYDKPSNTSFPLLPTSIALPGNPTSTSMAGSGRSRMFI